VKLTTHLQLVSRSRKCGSIHPLHHTPFWRSVLLVKHRDNFTFTNDVGFEILTEVVMKCAVFRGISPCSPLKVYRRFGGIYHLYLEGRRIF
jgi:hypothetical protein